MISIFKCCKELKMDTKIFLPGILFTVLSSFCCAKSEFSQIAKLKPEVGKPCPNFKLKNVTYYSKTDVTLNDFKGKWLFLDFWFAGCTSCIKSFPKVNQIQMEFKKEVQFLLIGKNDKRFNSNIQETFEKLAAKQGLQIASAYDSILVNEWSIYSMPHIIVIDPQGIVRYIIGGRDMTSQKIKDLVEGKHVAFYSKEMDRTDFNPESYINEDMLLYRSILTKWNGETQNGGIGLDQFSHNTIEFLKKGWTVSMVPLYALYNYAYIGRWTWSWRDPDFYGKYYYKPVLEMQDSSLFDYDYRFNVGKGTYNYSLNIPPGKVSKEYLMEEIRSNLKSIFGYEVLIDVRQMPVWKLIAMPGVDKKLKTMGGTVDTGLGNPQTGYKNISAGFAIKNQPITHLLNLITSIVSEGDLTPFFDETNITTNIDITIEADLTDFEDIKKALRRHGLDFVRSTKKMKVVVIRDTY